MQFFQYSEREGIPGPARVQRRGGTALQVNRGHRRSSTAPNTHRNSSLLGYLVREDDLQLCLGGWEASRPNGGDERRHHRHCL